MRKSSPFVSIPTVPMTISGQWLAFSHMANHYRKILNVKPRIDTSMPKYNCYTSPYMDNPFKVPSKLKKPIRRQLASVPTEKSPKPQIKAISASQRPKTANTIDQEFKTPNKSLPKSARLASAKSNPTKLRESHEVLDFTTESDLDENISGVSTMDISEKIKLFLDQMQSFEADFNQVNRFMKKGPIRSREDINDAYLARHSQCLIPNFDKGENNITGSNNKPSFRNSPTPYSSPTSKPKPKPKQLTFKSDQSFLASRGNIRNVNNSSSLKVKTPLQKTPIKANAKPMTTTPKFRNAQEKLEAEIQTLKAAEIKRKVERQRTRSPGSISGGTIRGSDELTESRLLPQTTKGKTSTSSGRRNANRERTGIVENQEISSTWLKEKVDKGLIRINNAYFQLGNGTTTTTPPTTTPPAAPGFGIPLNNKDSSRDSAYGFSSGESRITTRESTPEKMGNGTKGKPKKRSPDANQYKSSLSTVASSNQDSPARSVQYNKPRITSDADWMADNRYIDFLTAVTEDIVSRGIYTNKGLKTLFQSHMDRNKGLDTDKMMHMLNRLRMDVGVPMDDSLNQMEFGYGSVKYSTPPFFYRNHDPVLTSTTKSVGNESDLSVLELHHRKTQDYHSTDEGNSKASSCNTSIILGDSRRRSRRVSSPSSKDSSSTSLTESEMARALQEVGFDSETTMDIVNIVNHRGRSKVKASCSSSSLPQHRVSFPTSKPTSVRSDSVGSGGSY